MKCRECGTAKARREDPRDPPVDEGECLCVDCFISAAEIRLEELDEEAASLRSDLIRDKKRKGVRTING